MKFSFDVSRETIEKLEIYEILLKKWQAHVNLVSKLTLHEVWERHFSDSAQLFNFISNKDSLVCDIGSGAGFPGAILAIMGCSNVTLIERDRKKCSFLRAVSRETGVAFKVFEGDVKAYSEKADYVTSRALASLSNLLNLSKHLITPQTTCLFLKGTQVDFELSQIPSSIKMKILKKQSTTSKEAAIIHLKDIFFR